MSLADIIRKPLQRLNPHRGLVIDVPTWSAAHLGESAQLGRNTVLGGGGGQYTFTVTLELEDPDSVELGQLRTIIEEEKPAHTSYTLRIVPKNPQNEG